MAKVEQKAPVVAEISEAIKDAQSVVLVDYRGLTVEQDTALRKQLREAGVTYKVYKNTMMNFAFKGTDFEALAPYLEGPSAVAISPLRTQPLPPESWRNSQRPPTSLRSRPAFVEGTVYDAAGMAAISQIPSRDELLSRAAWKHPVPDRELRPRHEAARRERRRRRM